MRAGHDTTMFWLMPPSLRRVLLEPVERRVERPRPAGRHVVVGLVGAPHVVELHLHVDRQFREPLKNATSLGVPSGPPSALVPLSPLM